MLSASPPRGDSVPAQRGGSFPLTRNPCSEDDEIDEQEGSLKRVDVTKGHCHILEGEQVQASPMPKELRNRVGAAATRGFLATGPTSGGVDTICVVRIILGALFGFVQFRLFSRATHLGFVATVAGTVLGLQGTIMAVTNVRPLWQQLVVGWPTRYTSDTYEAPARGLTDSYLETLLMTPLSERGVAAIESLLHSTARVSFFAAAGIGAMGAAVIAVEISAPSLASSEMYSNATDGAVESAPDDTLARLTIAAGIATMLFYAPLVGVQNLSVMLTKELACLVVKDVARQVSAHVRHSTAETLDFDEITNEAYQLHLETKRLSSLLSVPMVGNGVYYCTIMFTSLFIAIEPHPDPGCLWMMGLNGDIVDTSSCPAVGWVFYVAFYLLSPPFWILLAITVLVVLVKALFAAANVTSECQRLGSAVNHLRAPVLPGTLTAKLATTEMLMKIEGLQRFINGLNNDQGLGILLLSTRITEGMVWSVSVWGISALFAVGLVLLKTHMVNHEDGVVSQALVALVGP